MFDRDNPKDVEEADRLSSFMVHKVSDVCAVESRVQNWVLRGVCEL